MSSESAIVLMAKQPLPGTTKTRLCPPFTPEEAALFYEAMLKDSLALVEQVDGARLAVAVSPPNALPYFQHITRHGSLLLPISGENIGVCLLRSFQALFDRGFRKVLALNTDGPSLPVEYLARAVRHLDQADLVLGPGEDGGYYLIGMTQHQPAVFDGIPWSTSAVFSHTLARAEQLHLKVALTPPWYDVDHLPDVLRLVQEVQQIPPGRLENTRRFFQEHPPECAET